MTNSELIANILHYCSRKSPVTVEEINEAIPHVGLAAITEVAGELVEARLLRATATPVASWTGITGSLVRSTG